jgi:hypothetical protein
MSLMVCGAIWNIIGFPVAPARGVPVAASVQTEFVVMPRDQAAAILYCANTVFQISGAVLPWSECVAWVLNRTKSGHPKFLLRETNVLRTPKLEHPVQRVHGNGDLGRSTPIGAGS